MPIRLGRNSYGKSRVRLLRLVRGPDGNDIHELAVAIRFYGEFEAVHTVGDNRPVPPTDTMKNTVYALAQSEPVGAAELFAGRLIKHFLDTCPEADRVEVDIREDLWGRIDSRGKPHATAFVRAGEEKRTAALSGAREGTTIRAGLENLIAMKTSQSAFEGF